MLDAITFLPRSSWSSFLISERMLPPAWSLHCCHGQYSHQCCSIKMVEGGCRESGFLAHLPADDVKTARKMLDLLNAASWLDSQTRALFIEFSLFLPSSNLLLAARLVVEVHPVGTIWTDLSLEPVPLSVYSTSNKWQMLVQILTAIVAVAAFCWEIWHTVKMRPHRSVRTSAVRLATVCVHAPNLIHI
jgi:hypothetical protein